VIFFKIILFRIFCIYYKYKIKVNRATINIGLSSERHSQWMEPNRHRGLKPALSRFYSTGDGLRTEMLCLTSRIFSLLSDKIRSPQMLPVGHERVSVRQISSLLRCMWELWLKSTAD